ncbi:hypothetical protein [Cryptosporangium phraense]|uniref:DUF2306 domain-containing protein n=1 Tax=Cryptosporangium phraense TaxID=2593070 RepID=A0A545AK98_9ACTN|nr:hypothetical protein [Cryptosporangium phraense]TQS41175.1 hypothetical protein FL583_31075 [Cryptosporangium phraense]
MHDLLIGVHAVAAIACFVAGCTVVARLPRSVRSPGFLTFAVAGPIAVAALIAVILVDWSGLPTAKRLTFGGLALLGLYLLWRIRGATAALRDRPAAWEVAFIGHVGFVLISLFDGFAIVTALDLHAPGVVVAACAVLGVVAGVAAIRLATRREERARTATS